MLGELASEVEATKAQGNGEEEGSSFTPGKDDNEGNFASDEDQIVDATDELVEAQHKEQAQIEVGECAGERDHEEITPIIERKSKLFFLRCQYNIILLHP